MNENESVQASVSEVLSSLKECTERRWECDAISENPSTNRFGPLKHNDVSSQVTSLTPLAFAIFGNDSIGRSRYDGMLRLTSRSEHSDPLF